MYNQLILYKSGAFTVDTNCAKQNMNQIKHDQVETGEGHQNKTVQDHDKMGDKTEPKIGFKINKSSSSNVC